MPFQKGHKLATGRPLGSLNRETLNKLERRAIFDEQISQRWEAVINELPPSYIADQYLGPVKQKLDVTTDDEKLPSLDLDALAVAMALQLKGKKTNAESTDKSSV